MQTETPFNLYRRVIPMKKSILFLTVIFTVLSLLLISMLSVSAKESGNISAYSTDDDETYMNAIGRAINGDGECTSNAKARHSFTDKLSRDEEAHYYQCEYCETKKDAEPHTWERDFSDSFFVIRQTRKCELCNYSEVSYGPMFTVFSVLMYAVMAVALAVATVSRLKKNKTAKA